MVSCRGIDELSRDARAVARLAYTTLEHVPDAEFSTELFDIDGAPLVM